jgi:hypothetical protein
MKVVSTNLGIDNSVEKLATKGTQEIMRIVEQKPENSSKNVMVLNGIILYIARITTNTLTGQLSFPLIL